MSTVPRHLSRLAAVAALSLMCAAGAAVLPDDRADLFWSQLQGRRHGHHRRIGAGAQEVLRAIRRGGELLRRQGQRRVGGRAEQRQRHQGRAQAEESLGRLHPRQDSIQSFVHQQHRTRLHLEHHAFLPEPGHVRRFDHRDSGLHRQPQQGRGEQRQILCTQHCLAGPCGKPQLRRRPVADHHQEPDRGRHAWR